MAQNHKTYLFELKETQFGQKFCTELLKSGDFSDANFVIGGIIENYRVFKAHRLILMAASPKFRELFSKNEKEELITLPNINPKVFEQVLKVVYTNRLELDSIEFTEKCLKAFEEFGLSIAVDQCKEHLEEIRKNPKPFKCEFCLKVYFNAKSFRTHHKTHEGRFKCDLCGKDFSTKFILCKHIKRIHLNIFVGSQIQKRSKCEICDKVLRTDSMERHVRTIHEGNYKFKCIVCKKQFNIAQKLLDHLAFKHLKEELYKCSICDKNFSSKHDLNVHIKGVHEKIVVAKCEKCGRNFRNMCNFRRHLKLHEKKPFSCHLNSCVMNFKSENELKKHLAISHITFNNK